MNLENFTREEKQALLHLLVLGIYSDRHIAAAEDARLRKLTDEIDLASDYERQQLLDAAFTRARQQQPGIAPAGAAIQELRERFSTPLKRQEACLALEELLGSDQQVTESERTFLNSVTAAFRAA